ncbi:hypothetical protein WICPIJ_008280 [Wickerhamomyces pijperi]|uniref:Uncharacterized protein n=1 Tax=Wickerhamomyces pijperi TaxID=599730 RepID=A0A9P8TJB8_WICPI|nr:hypothetical protein WICPIJ_008280 [Wickerhamomyces pijperi]
MNGSRSRSRTAAAAKPAPAKATELTLAAPEEAPEPPVELPPAAAPVPLLEDWANVEAAKADKMTNCWNCILIWM